MGTVRIDDDLIGMGLSIDQAHTVQEKRKDAKDRFRKIDGMAESYEKRVEPHQEAIEVLEAEILSILPEGAVAFPWRVEESVDLVEGDAATGEPTEPQEPSATRLTRVD